MDFGIVGFGPNAEVAYSHLVENLRKDSRLDTLVTKVGCGILIMSEKATLPEARAAAEALLEYGACKPTGPTFAFRIVESSTEAVGAYLFFGVSK